MATTPIVLIAATQLANTVAIQVSVESRVIQVLVAHPGIRGFLDHQASPASVALRDIRVFRARQAIRDTPVFLAQQFFPPQSRPPVTLSSWATQIPAWR